MGRFLYVTDLHGRAAAYELLLDSAVRQKIPLIVNGGDMLPKTGGDDLSRRQAEFIEFYLPEWLDRCRENGIQTMGMFGNDDLACHRNAWLDVLGKHGGLDLSGAWHEVDGYWFGGCSHVPDYPFGLKDWTVLDAAGDEPSVQWSTPVLSAREGFRTIPDLREFFAHRPTLAQILHDWGDRCPHPARAVMVIHCPPYGYGLGTLYTGEDKGSESVAQFLAARQPFLTLHGHIHESPAMSGVHTARIGQTLCHQPGQRLPEEVSYSTVLLDGATVEAERHIMSLRRWSPG